jgi:dienelactone hydrolase
MFNINFHSNDTSKGGAMKIYPLYIFLTVIFLFGVPVNAAGAEIVNAEVVYYQNGKNVSGYLARPADTQKHPGLILIHEWWGLNDNIRENARKFAELGYAALAVDLYEGSSATTPDEARKLATGVRKNVEGRSEQDASDNSRALRRKRPGYQSG